MSQVLFKKEIITAKIRNPLKNFSLSEESIEIRWDPLLKFSSRITKPKGLDKVPEGKPLEEFINTAKSCFFCKGKVESQTPMLPESIDKEGRIAIDEALVFPNLSGFGLYSGVCIFSKKHFLAIDEFTEALILNALKACQVYLQKCFSHHSQVLYPSINGNYLLPAGSSILHPHLQPFLDPFPTNFHRHLLETSQKFYDEYHQNFWDLLKKEETKNRERFLFETDNCYVYVPFAPQGFNEINVLIGAGQSYLEFRENVLGEISQIIQKILFYYNKIGHNSFNLTLFSPAAGLNHSNNFPCLLKICSRPVFQGHYRNDITFFEKFHLESMLDQSPESVAQEFRSYL
jgi:galactose-1-phosphate uridylyltransferase